jgi:DNA-binding winged helix-turn-helix (wHTH) protein/tetratricopeptide (TPR) repeat protein/TolB-like protein
MLASPPRILQFDEFTLDGVRGVLVRCGSELPLRRQSFEVLRYLVEHAGEVVSSDELIEALWSSKPADSNASVVQCIKEIRRAIGHDARWIIKTVSGSGYEFMAAVVPLVPPPPDVAPSTAGTATPAAAPTTAAASESGMPAGVVSGRPSRRLHWLLAVALVVALVPVGWMLWRSQQVPGPQGVLTMMAAPTIAVLPFATLGPEHGLEAGLEAEIRSELARAHRGFDLVIRSASDDRDRSASPKIAGARLGARYVVVGTTSLDLDVQRANIRLIETETDQQIWSEPFEFKRRQSGAVNSMAARIARLLIIQVRTAESKRPLPAQVEAGHYALQGRALHETERGPESTREAQSLFKRALELDPNSVSALQGFATTRIVQVHNAWIPWEERHPALIEAGDAIERLIKLDPRNAAGHHLRASRLRALDDVDKAIASLDYALSLNPNYFPAHAELGRIKIDAGRGHEAIAHIEQAIKLNPPDPNMHVLYYWAGMAALHIADDQAAVQWLLKARQANPAFSPSALLLAVAYLGIGEEGQARASLAEFLKTAPNISIALWKRWVPAPHPIGAKQRERILDALRRLGVPEDAPAVAR